MEKIASKQVEGVVDLNSFQRIPARKEFLGGVGAGNGSTGHYPLLSGGFIYSRDPKCYGRFLGIDHR